MKTMSEFIFDRLEYSCLYEAQRGKEDFYGEHILGFQLAGETHILLEQSTHLIKENMAVLLRKNQLFRTTNYPSKSGVYKFITITLDNATLKQYAIENEIEIKEHYHEVDEFIFEPSEFLHSYFLLLAPYINKTKQATAILVDGKIKEVIELLIDSNPVFGYVLFDFSESQKNDLEGFMNKNFMFNVPLETFAKLTGTSISTFKRNFSKIFNCTPKQWLKNKRLEEAYHLIKYKKQKPIDFYLDIGFENLSHFYSSFKLKYKATTTEIE
ncbi:MULTISPECIES: AraC family transcriptional regulator [Chryseobacterium]|uniref:helix-turn-helix domain-containing protein n=1 Tax=Chryseobacterium TaxID=59732 RepID=UPI0012973120|nr:MULTISPECIES: AraC family transcriptional regulator [Chryseobacterium]MDR6919840.1 AraC-like DNA-binding protein [Chryseobacterium sp. 2987]